MSKFVSIARLTLGTILEPTPWCVVRKQNPDHLFYNSRTDELHLVPPAGFMVYGLCDGRRTVAEIESEVAEAMGEDTRSVRGPLLEFLERLVARGVLEPAADA